MTRPATVLLVDDNRSDVELTLEVFRDSRLANAISVASSGEEALEYLLGKGKYADRQSHPIPDLILLDLKMPGLDGFDVLSQVRRTAEIKLIPVIVLTGSNEEGHRAMSFDLGANGYLLKPISFDRLMHAIREIGDYWIVMNVKD